jgi:phosphodiesterase/alkaline phosphatase D-like protein
MKIVMLFTSLFLAITPCAHAKFTFAVAADSRSGYDQYGLNKTILTKIYQQMKKDKPDLVFFPGDLIAGSPDLKKHKRELQRFYNLTKKHLNMATFYPQVGNHELFTVAQLDQFRETFTLPKNGPQKYQELTYYVKHKNNLFISLTTDYYV